VTKEEKYLKWLENAEDDLDTAECMLKLKKYMHTIFMCQQAIEKLAKGIFVYNFGKEAPYTHNMCIVLKDIEEIISSDEYKNDYEKLFNRLTSHYIIGRYDVYKQKLADNLNEEETKLIFDKTKEAFLWLKSKVKLSH